MTYTPAAGFQGLNTFAYAACDDGRGGSGAAPVEVVVATPPGTVPNKGPVLVELKQYAVGADTSGGPRVTVYNPDGSVRFDFFAYDPSTRFGANVVFADVNGEDVADVLTSPGYGGAPHVRVFDGKDLHLVREFMAFDQNFRGGCTIAAGDYNGDGIVDLAVAAGQGGGPRVFVIDGRKFDDIVNAEVAASARLADFFAFDPKFGGGVSVAATDLDGDGVAELVTGAGPGGPPTARVWDARAGRMLSEFLAFDPSLTKGGERRPPRRVPGVRDRPRRPAGGAGVQGTWPRTGVRRADVRAAVAAGPHPDGRNDYGVDSGVRSVSLACRRKSTISSPMVKPFGELLTTVGSFMISWATIRQYFSSDCSVLCLTRSMSRCRPSFTRTVTTACRSIRGTVLRRLKARYGISSRSADRRRVSSIASASQTSGQWAVQDLNL